MSKQRSVSVQRGQRDIFWEDLSDQVIRNAEKQLRNIEKEYKNVKQLVYKAQTTNIETLEE